ncbi:putative orphan protein [Pseudoalteromonas translucida]|uniref:Orphan protein n=1 Tax=Pseudoalteromonas translucida (strain TAC 125) TaxID=326442 RepID=Q3IEG8_PSET1|nr:putative orphan protein [Pseudoalteromonas translucida]
MTANTQHCYFVIAEDDLGNESPASNERFAIVEAFDVMNPTVPMPFSAEPTATIVLTVS